MFTWEEAGLLRSMLLVLKWALVLAVLGLVLLEHQPLGAAIKTGLHAVEHRLDTSSRTDAARVPAH